MHNRTNKSLPIPRRPPRDFLVWFRLRPDRQRETLDTLFDSWVEEVALAAHLYGEITAVAGTEYTMKLQPWWKRAKLPGKKDRLTERERRAIVDRWLRKQRGVAEYRISPFIEAYSGHALPDRWWET